MEQNTDYQIICTLDKAIEKVHRKIETLRATGYPSELDETVLFYLLSYQKDLAERKGEKKK